MTESAFVVSNPGVVLGKPTIRGTRITVEMIAARAQAGQSETEILLAYPHLTRESIRAAIAFAGKVSRNPAK